MKMKEKIDFFINDAKKLYDNNDLPYHNFNHVQSMLDMAEKYNCKLTMSQMLAILYHDCVYVPGAKDNEEQSAKTMCLHVDEDGVNPFYHNEIATAERIILDTKDHIATREESKLVIDLDLASLGYEWKVFSESTKNIYNEYKKFYVDKSDRDFDFEVLFHQGNINFGNRMLSRSNIYYTDLFRNMYEKRATINLFKMINESQTMLKIYEESSTNKNNLQSKN